MKLKVIGSSSKGNSYALIASNEILLLEAGCKLMDVKKAIDWQIGKVVGCITSHAHQDHAGRIKEYMQSGIQVFSSEEVGADIEERGGERIKALPPGERIKIGGFSVQWFTVVHDCPCVGYLVLHPEMGKLVFATDTEYVKYRFRDLNHIMIESNYSKEFLDENDENSVKRNHVLYGHMSIETAVNFVKHNASYNLRNVILMHLSDNNGDQVGFREMMQQAVDCPVYVAEPGLEAKLNKGPF